MISNKTLYTDITYLKGVGKYYGKLFNIKDIYNIRDLINYYPVRYEDRSNITSIHESLLKSISDENYISTLIVRCVEKSSFVFRNREIPKYYFTDSSALVCVSAFNPAHNRFKLEDK